MKSKIIKSNGVFEFQVDNQIIDALAFKSFRPTNKNVKDFYDAGVRIFHVYCSGLKSGLKAPYSLYGETWLGDHIYDWANLDKQIDFFIKNAPDGYLFINIHLDVREWWLKNNPGNVNSFTHLSQIACNQKWKEDTADYLKALIKHVEEKYNKRVIGYFLLGGYTTEWFSEYDKEEGNVHKLNDYRRYMNNELINIPTKDILERPRHEVLLNNHLDQILPYRKYHNSLIADTVLYFAHQAQSILNHNKIVGVFFGYILELISERMWNAGHIEFDKINNSPDIDLIATPSSYQFRSFDGPGAFMLLNDSLLVNNKAIFISFDHTTYLVPSLINNKERLCGDKETGVALKLLAEMRSRNKKDLLIDKHQTIQAMRREFMQRIYKRTGYWWFDMLEGWFYDKDLMDEVRNEVITSKHIMNIKRDSVSEVAVFVSGQSLYYINKMSEINTETICNQREGLNKMGAPYDIYSLNDIDKLDLSKYKVLIFIECLLLSDYQRELINKLKNKNITLLFIGPVDYAKNKISSTSELLEMKLEKLDTLENKIECGFTSYGYYNKKSDSIYINDESVNKVGNLKDSNLLGFGYKKIKEATMFYSALGNLSYQALQYVLNYSNVHIYNKEGFATFVCDNFIGIHAPNVNEISLNLKENGTYKEIFTNEIYEVKNKTVTFDTSINCARMLEKIK